MRCENPLIAHVLHSLHLAGAEILAAGLSNNLAGRFRFAFFCLDERGSLADDLQQQGHIVESLDRAAGLDGSLPGRLHDRCRHHGVGLIHAHQYTPFFYSLLSRRGGSHPPILFTEHGRHYPDRASLKHALFNRLMLCRRDVQTMARNMTRLLEDAEQRLAMGRAGQCRHRDQFTLECMHARYAEIYQQMLADTLLRHAA